MPFEERSIMYSNFDQEVDGTPTDSGMNKSGERIKAHKVSRTSTVAGYRTGLSDDKYRYCIIDWH